jgi:prepilin-type N-terminal cleavage/methylation domain-containing protein
VREFGGFCEAEDRTVRNGRKRASGFTLTEILMAVGILGVGLTMVATIFPVAVNQNRQSVEMTQAALYARSVYAMMRARRADVLSKIRAKEDVNTAQPGTPEALRLDNTTDIAGKFNVYYPYAFEYNDDWNRTDLPDTGAASDRWAGGGFTGPIFWNHLQKGGPYRITLVACAARGTAPTMNSVPGNTAPTGTAPGDYVVDWTYAATTGRGEAYQVDYLSSTLTLDKTLAAPIATGTPRWVCVPGAVMAFHAVIGD